MKKLISMILCLSTAFALSACAELDAIRNTKLPPLPTPEVRATEEPAPVEIESAPEASRDSQRDPGRDPAAGLYRPIQGGHDLGRQDGQRTPPAF